MQEALSALNCVSFYRTGGAVMCGVSDSIRLSIAAFILESGLPLPFLGLPGLFNLEKWAHIYITMNNHVHGHAGVCMYTYITGYGSTLYIGIAMVFSSHLQFQLLKILYTVQRMSKPNILLKYNFWPKHFPILFMFFFFFSSLNSRNSISILPIDMKLCG